MLILMMIVRDMINDKIMGLDVGVDDYVVKLVDLGELFVRV